MANIQVGRGEVELQAFDNLHIAVQPNDSSLAANVINGYITEVSYDSRTEIYEEVRTSPSDSGAAPQTSLQIKQSKTRNATRFTLVSRLVGEASLSDAIYPATASVQILGFDGIARVTKTITISEESKDGVVVLLTKDDVAAIGVTTALPPPKPQPVARPGIFVDFGGGGSAKAIFTNAQLLVAPLFFGSSTSAWADLGFAELLQQPHGPVTASTSLVNTPVPPTIASLTWAEARVAVDGRFTATFPVGTGDVFNAWAWLLTGVRTSEIIVGVIASGALRESTDQVQAIILPTAPAGQKKSAGSGDDAWGDIETGGGDNGRLARSHPSDLDCGCKDPGQATAAPRVADEAELANNPQIYTEDAGAFCRPFSNPERVLTERSFYSILRAEQPAISAAASSGLVRPIAVMWDSTLTQTDTIPRFDANTPETTVPKIYFDPDFHYKPGVKPPWGIGSAIRDFGSGRHEMSDLRPIQWEGDSLRYQATTVAVGHVLEIRLRTRSNGYSLGSVAKTLTLAPRQTKRIQKIEWSRSERAARREGFSLTDTTSDAMSHETSYMDAVSASLSEWAQGSSSGKVKSSAAGIGLASLPVVIGGGVAHSSGKSSSQQSGGRNAAAAEESNWRDAVRRHGDALRKLDSMVVQEVMQNETVTGTTEVIRNINYAHSITVIYHNILRHLRVDTEVASVRECLFVPFAISPFTLERAMRWKDSLRRGLRDRKFNAALDHLKEVANKFVDSPIPAGRRSDHPIRSLWGSIYIDLGVARPADLPDGTFSPDLWNPLLPLLSTPATGIWSTTSAAEARFRDSIFQSRFAPSIATKWCESLNLAASNGVILNCDFTLATNYSFGRSVRIDFQVETDGSLTREALSKIKINATRWLPPGSVANVRSLSFSYETDWERNAVSASRGLNHIVSPETGNPDEVGAVFTMLPSIWERQDMQKELTKSAQDLLDHLNEFMEYYHKVIWWYMDRDRLFMLLDGFTVPRLSRPVSIANVVERDPIAMAGNCLVFRVSSGVFLGGSDIDVNTPEELFDYYNSNTKGGSAPMHISLPTDGLYAQTIMDECVALEEHFGSLDWALSDPDPELGVLDSGLLTSRRADVDDAGKPTQLPSTIIQLSNATPAPQPQGLADLLGAVQNSGAFRDMAGLQGTQQMTTAGLQAATSLATSFGNMAAGKLADTAGKQAAVADADKKLASIQRAKDKGLVSAATASDYASKVLGELNSPPSAGRPSGAPHQDPAIQEMLRSVAENPDVAQTVEASNAEGSFKLAVGGGDDGAGGFQLAAATAAGVRPSWKAFRLAYWDYPSVESAWVIATLNPGWVHNPWYQNSCCMRISQALNTSGVRIPRSGTYSDVVADRCPNGLRYIVGVPSMWAFLGRVWGNPDVRKQKRAGEEFDPTTVPEWKSNKGVVGFKIQFSDGANGHFDVWNGSQFTHEMTGGWNGVGMNPHDYWKNATEIGLWILKDPVSTGSGGSGEGGTTI